MRRILSFLFLLGTAFAQFQQPTRTLYVFQPPKSGGSSSDEQIVVSVPNGSAAMSWCDMNGGCAGSPSQVAGNAFNPKFSPLWVNLPVLVNGVSNTITSCASGTGCTLLSTVASGCSNFCTLRITNMYLNELNNRMLVAGSPFNGVAITADWDDVDMSGSVNVQNGSTAITFNSVNQHCQNTSGSCAPTAFACSSAWNGKAFKIYDSAGAADRSVTLTDCTHLSTTYAGATNAAQLFHGLYDFTIPDALITTYAINSKKVALIVRAAASSGVNISTPAFVSGTDFAASQIQTNTNTGTTVSTTTGSNLITFSGGNEYNWAGTITIGGGVGAVVIDHCILGGLWGYSTTTCVLQSNAGATATNTTFTWIPSASEVCMTSGGYGGGLVGAVINGITYGATLTNACGNVQLGSAPVRTSQNPTGINVYYSFPYQQAYIPFAEAFLSHYAGNSNVAYMRIGGWQGGEKYPWGQSIMAALTPSSSISDPAWTKYLFLANDDAEETAFASLALTPANIIMSSANNCAGPALDTDYSCADMEYSDALFHNLNGFGSQGVSFLDAKGYAGRFCSADHCKWFDYINSCEANAPYVGCNAHIVSPFLLEIQQSGPSDFYNTFLGVGTAVLPVSAVRTGGQTVVTFNVDPTSGVKTDGSSAISLMNWDASFNGTYQIINSSAGAKTLTFNQPNLPNATSVAVGSVGNGVFGSWTITFPFEYHRGADDAEIYFNDAATMTPDPTDTYHSAIATGAYTSTGGGLGPAWLSLATGFITNAIP